LCNLLALISVGFRVELVFYINYSHVRIKNLHWPVSSPLQAVLDACCSYACLDVAWSACLSVCVSVLVTCEALSPAKMAGPIEMQTRASKEPCTLLLDWGTYEANLYTTWQTRTHARTHARTHNRFTALDFIRDNQGELVPKETFTHLHLS